MSRRALAPAVAALAAFLPALAHAGADHRRSGSVGVGLGGGTNAAGLSAKVFLSDASALQAVAGTYGKWGGGAGIGLNADYLYEMPTLADTEPVEIAWNLGAGAGLGVFPAADTLSVAVAGVAGLEFAFKPVPLDLVLEYRPTVTILQKTGLDLINFTGHLRWFF